MKARKVYRAIGLMSGTSLDGADAALIETDGAAHVRALGFYTQPYTDEERAEIRSCFGIRNAQDPQVRAAAEMLTRRHARAVRALGAGHADIIGFHGQTIAHDPGERFTLQIGDGGLLARETGIDVVDNFRSADIRAGGQGAPLLPLYHRARALADNLPRPLAILNIGGVANVTWIGKSEDDILAFDTGPGNALIDDFILKRTGNRYDDAGQTARRGRADKDLVRSWMQLPYFKKPAPKSLDRNAWQSVDISRLSDADGAATMTEFTAEAVRHAADGLPARPSRWLVTGGGRRNAYMMERLEDLLGSPVQAAETAGWNGDALEAEGFAYLAVRSLLGEPLSLPQTTGVPAPRTGGVLHRAG